MSSLEQLSIIDQTIESNMENTMEDFGQRMFNSKLMALRAQNPFIPILPLPNSAVSVLLAPNTPVTIPIPSEAKLAYPSGDQVYYLSRNGNAQVPAALAAGSTLNDSGIGSFQNPEGMFLYVEEVSSLSVISPVACNFTMGFYAQQ